MREELANFLLKALLSYNSSLFIESLMSSEFITAIDGSLYGRLSILCITDELIRVFSNPNILYHYTQIELGDPDLIAKTLELAKLTLC